MKVVSFSIFKGGTGKTASAVHTAAARAKKKKRTLLIDLDQQASSTRYMNLSPEVTLQPEQFANEQGQCSSCSAGTDFGRRVKKAAPTTCIHGQTCTGRANFSICV